jgi:DNA-binding SARP family transcriptional activator
MVRLASRPGPARSGFPLSRNTASSRNPGARFEHDWSECVRLTQSALGLLEGGDAAGAQALLTRILTLAPNAHAAVAKVWDARILSGQIVRASGCEHVPPEPHVIAGEGAVHRSTVSDAITDAVRYPIQIRALGGFDLVINGERFVNGVKPQRRPLDLLKALVAANGSMASACELADKLWPDSDGDTGRNSLQVAIHRLRRLLASDQAVVVQDRKVYLDHALCWVDLWAFAEEAEWAMRSGPGHPKFVEQAVAAMRLYRGHLFAQEPEQAWMLAPRERVRRTWACLVRRLGDYYEVHGEWQQASALYQQALDVDAVAEDVYRRLMGCQLRTGERAEAMHTYRRCCEELASALGVAPSAETERLHQALRLAA